MTIILTIHYDIKMFHFKQIEGFKIKKIGEIKDFTMMTKLYLKVNLLKQL